MIKKILLICFLSIPLSFFVASCIAQESTPAAKFDVIIKKDGSIIYGLVQEVGLLEIKYKRTDILRKEVYAISYRNQVKEYLAPVNESIFDIPQQKDTVQTYMTDFSDALDFNDQELKIQFGFFKGFSKLKDQESYISKMGLIPFTLSYDVAYKSKYRLGASIGFASYKYNKNEFNTYDSTQLVNDVKEKQFVANVYVKKRFGSGKLQPFALLGLGINSALIQSSTVVSLDNSSAKRLLISSEGRSTSLGVQIRAGFDYGLSDNLKLSADVGTGLSTVQLGLIFKF